jgi:hypothetical protein
VIYITDDDTGTFSVKERGSINIQSVNARVSMSRGLWKDNDMTVNFYTPESKGIVYLTGKCPLSIPAHNAVYDIGGDSLHITGTDSLIYAHSYIIPGEKRHNYPIGW